jgi:hypothetical protein
MDHPDAPTIQQHLLSRGVRALLQKAGEGRGTRVTFVLNATHKWDELAQFARALDATVKGEKTHEWANSI